MACPLKALTSQIITVIKLCGWQKVLLVVACVLPLALFSSEGLADDGLAVDAQFDKTGDGIVDASDWKLMKQDDRAAYARASVAALGENPEIQLPGGKTRAEIYLDGLSAVYE